MKKTILLLVFVLGIISLNSCSRGYGCPYTMDVTIQNQNADLAERDDQKNNPTKAEAAITTQTEAFEIVVMAD